MIILRDYQLSFKSDLSKALKEHKAVIACAGTGSGKTKTFLSIAQDAANNGFPVLILTESSKIFKQIKEEFSGIAIDSNVKHIIIEPGKIYVGMAQTLKNRPNITAQFSEHQKPTLVINDEAHINTATPVIEAIEKKLLIGFTATPHYKWAKHLPKLYNELVSTLSVEELIKRGYLCDYLHTERQAVDLSGLEKDSKGEFSSKSQNNVYNKAHTSNLMFDDIKNTQFKKAIVFCSSIETAEKTNEEFLKRGYASICYHSKTESPEYTLAKFTELGLANICVSVGTLTKGFDCPDIDLVILYRATTSLPLYLQMIGRGSRTAEGKNNFFTVLDYGMNGSRHGLYYKAHDWAELWRETKKEKAKKLGEAPVKLCPQCEALLQTSAKICKYCNHVLPVTEAEERETQLVELTNKFQALAGRTVMELSAEDLAYYIKINKHRSAYGFRVARHHETTQPGYLEVLAQHLGYKSQWVRYQKTLLEKEGKPQVQDIRVKREIA